MNKDRRLGRGLAALLGTVPGQEPGPNEPASAAPAEPPDGVRLGEGERADRGDGLVQLNVYQIDDNPFQPRRDFGDSEIAGLAESLKSHQMLQPILVRKCGDRYQLISGERRLRAAIRAGWSTVPAQVRDADDRLVAELAIVENLQRKNLNPIEKALSFQRYLQEHGCTQEQLAERLKIDRSTIANLLRLLELPSTVVDTIRQGSITAGHGRALLPLGDEAAQCQLATAIIDQGWSVRETERQVSDRIAREDDPGSGSAGGGATGGGAANGPSQTGQQQADSLAQRLRTALGTRVDIRTVGKQRGRITIHFSNHDEFERLFGLLCQLGGQDSERKAG